MGIDIYLKWPGMTDEEKQNQITGYSTTSGNVGYLREAYHGGPYATKILVREAFEASECEAQIPAATMRMRLKCVTEPARGVEGGDMLAMLLPELLKKIHNGSEDKEPVTISGAHSGNVHTAPMSVEEAIRLRCNSLYPEDGEDYIYEVTKSFREFVALAERKEKETGEPCTVLASY
jgi:hypothetical protein